MLAPGREISCLAKFDNDGGRSVNHSALDHERLQRMQRRREIWEYFGISQGTLGAAWRSWGAHCRLTEREGLEVPENWVIDHRLRSPYFLPFLAMVTNWSGENLAAYAVTNDTMTSLISPAMPEKSGRYSVGQWSP